MAARRADDWLIRAATPDASLLGTLNDASVPQVELRLGALLG